MWHFGLVVDGNKIKSWIGDWCEGKSQLNDKIAILKGANENGTKDSHLNGFTSS